MVAMRARVCRNKVVLGRYTYASRGMFWACRACSNVARWRRRNSWDLVDAVAPMSTAEKG